VAATTNEHIPEDIGMKVHDQLQAFLNTSADLKVWFGNFQLFNAWVGFTAALLCTLSLTQGLVWYSTTLHLCQAQGLVWYRTPQHLR
jgi:hypothetical protein